MARICSIIFVFILFLPYLQQYGEIFPTVKLGGVEVQTPAVSWTVNSWLDGSFQKAFSERRDNRLALRGYLVRTYNQIQYSLFGKIVSTSGTRVIIGKDNWLYEKQYIDKLNRLSQDDGYWMNMQAQALQFLQEALAQQGTTFVFVLAPSKPEIYHEYLPEDIHIEPLPKGKKTDYEYLRDALNTHGVNFVDTHALFLSEKREKDYQLFGPSGTHWNKYGAYLVWKEIEKKVNGRMNNSLQVPLLARVEKRPSEEIDADLGALLNLWDTELITSETDYPVFQTRQSREGEKPSILLVGDSFLFTLVDLIKRADLSADVDAWYYFKRHFHYPAQDGRLMNLTAAVETTIDNSSVKWQSQFFEKDLVILVETKQWLPDIGFGYVQAAIEAVKLKIAEQPEN